MANPRQARSGLCSGILSLGRSLRLSGRIHDTCGERGAPKQLEFVRDLLAAEVVQREENRISRLLARAAFPVCKTFEGCESGQISFPDGFSIDQVRDRGFIRDRLSLVLYGPAGTGKTRLAVAAGIAACQLGCDVRFFTVASLVRLPRQAARSDRLDRIMRDLSKADLPILDERGHVPVDKDGARLLFQVVSDCYEVRGIVVTTSLEFSRRGSVLGDDQVAAIIDRLVHHGHLLLFEGQSYRMRNALMKRQADSDG